MFERFYAYPPGEWPWILRNIKQPEKEGTVHEIVDIGIYDLLKDPFSHSDMKLKNWVKMQPNGWKVVPDYPDIYGEFNCKAAKSFENTELSWELLQKYYDPADPTHMPVLQSNFGDLQSLESFILRFKREYGEPDKIGVGSLCQLNRDVLGAKMIRRVRAYFRDSWIHLFGLRVQTFELSWAFFNSYDTTAWTFPRGRGRASAKQVQRQDYFEEYIESINKIIHP